ncbi:hypothetical protein [Acidocella aromatica]|uniref:Uncharacterized protein n=1 Tax=Acidocella aromatica TaxID=1303579 RepID=A0A840V859_9PROT|nr:hypothetical protein [Acidocella aromatica]MBB5372148.1 hypothetical protein [Acidocella aromatica]
MKITKHLPALTVACALGFAPAAFAQTGIMSQMPGMAPITKAPAAAASAVTSSVTNSANNAASAATSSVTNAANNAANNATSAVTDKVNSATSAVKSVSQLTKASEFKTEAEATAACPGDTAVWTTLGKSKTYYPSSSKLYGKTKHGAYVCKAAAAAAGYHQAKN